MRTVLLAATAVAFGSGGGVKPVAAQSSSPSQATFREVLRIPHDDTSDSPSFHLTVAASIAADGTISVLDFFNYSVRIFGPNGGLLREFGREGRGPGEFTTPVALFTIADRIYVADAGARRLTWFTAAGQYRGDRAYPTRARSQGVGPSRVMPLRGAHVLVELATVYGNISAAQRYGNTRVVALDAGDRVKSILAEFPSGHPYAYSRSRPQFTTPAAGEYGRGGQVATLGDSLIVVVDAYRGLIRYFGATRDTISLLKTRGPLWEPRRVVVSDDDSVRTRAAAAGTLQAATGDVVVVYPEFEALVDAAIISSNGDVWLRERESTGGRVVRRVPGTSESYYVVPWQAGQPVRKVTLPPDLLLRSVNGDRVLGVHRDEDGVESIRLYSLVAH